MVLDMMFSLCCPFCSASCGASPDSGGEALVRDWLGRHLAQQHEDIMEMYLKSKEKEEPEDTNEYVNWRNPLGYQYTV
jgi:hypothetical protein